MKGSFAKFFISLIAAAASAMFISHGCAAAESSTLIFERPLSFMSDKQITEQFNYYIQDVWNDRTNGLESYIETSANFRDNMQSTYVLGTADEKNYVVEVVNLKNILNYRGGTMSAFVADSQKYINVYVPKDGYCVYATYNYKQGKTEFISRPHIKKGSEKQPIPFSSVAQRDVKKYCDKFGTYGGVYIFSDYGCDFAVISDKNDYPRYVIFWQKSDMWIYGSDTTRPDVFTYYAQSAGTNAQGIKLAQAFDYLYNSGKGQNVYDFSFVLNTFLAAKGRLAGDYVFEKKGFETLVQDKRRIINGLAYNFDANARCTGLFSGWGTFDKGKRYFRKGRYLTGTWKIGGVKYTFDKNGYLI